MRPLDSIPDPNAGAKLDPYELRVIGEKAVRLYLDGGPSMDDSVASAIKGSMTKLNSHHIQRVVEHANLRAFRELRQRAGGVGTAVSFKGGPASSISVMQKLGGSTEKEVPMIPKAEPSVKEANRLLLSKSRGIVALQMEKAASGGVPLSRSEEMDTVDLYVKLGEAAEQCRTHAAILAEKKASVGREICRYSNHSLREGATLGDVHRMLSSAAGDHHDLLKVAMDLVLNSARDNLGLMGIDAQESMEKAGSGNPNPNHPLYQLMTQFVKVSTDLVMKNGAATVLTDGRARLRSVLSQ